MRTAGGILLICAALLNAFGGLFRLGVGGFATVRGLAGGESGKSMDRAGETADPKELRRAGEKLAAGGGGWMGLGLMMIVAAHLQVVAGIQLFRARGRSLILTVALLGLVVEGLSYWLVGFGWGVAFCAAASIIAAIGAVGSEPAAPAAPAPA